MPNKSDSKALKIILDNIADLTARRRLVTDQVDVSFQMLADMIREELSGVTDSKELAHYKKIITEYCSQASVSDAMGFLVSLSDELKLPLSAISVSENGYEVFENRSSMKIAYVKNNYTDSAFLRFSRLLDSPKAAYSPNFEVACEEVYNGQCDYCILPIESVTNGTLFGFYSLIDRYDLKIFAVCDIDESHSSNRTRYALLSRKILVVPKNKKKYKSYFEFSMIDHDAETLSNIMSAANICSLGLYRINTIPVPYDDIAIKFYHIFETTNSSLLPYLMYLDIKYPSCKIIGQYIQID